MKPYTETELLINFTSWFMTLKPLPDNETRKLMLKAYKEAARYIEAENVSIYERLRSLIEENNQLKDKIVKLTSND